MTAPHHPTPGRGATIGRTTAPVDADSGPHHPDRGRERPPSPIRRLERLIGDLEIAALDNTALSAHAVVQIIDSRTLAVVVFEEADIAVLEQAIGSCDSSVKETTRTRDVITVTI